MTKKLPGEKEELEEKAREIEKKMKTANSLMQEFTEDERLSDFYQEKFQEYKKSLQTIDKRLKAINKKQEEDKEEEAESEEVSEDDGEES